MTQEAINSSQERERRLLERKREKELEHSIAHLIRKGDLISALIQYREYCLASRSATPPSYPVGWQMLKPGRGPGLLELMRFCDLLGTQRPEWPPRPWPKIYEGDFTGYSESLASESATASSAATGS